MDTAVLMEIENLRRASLAALREKYREVFAGRNAMPAPGASLPADRLAAAGLGRRRSLPNGLASGPARSPAMPTCAWSRREASSRWGANQSAPRAARGTAGQPDSRLPLPGTLLSRKWKGRTILVEVLAEGFRFENRHYPSLSAIAVAVTGTRWNGLAFFGLTGKGAEGAAPCGKIIRKGKSTAGSPALRHLHAQVDRRRPGTGLQLARCAAGGGRGLHPEPAARRMDRLAGAL